MLSNAYFLKNFRFDTAENEPAKNLQNFANNYFPNFGKRDPAASLPENGRSPRPDSDGCRAEESAVALGGRARGAPVDALQLARLQPAGGVANKDFSELELRTSPNFRTSLFVEIANFTELQNFFQQFLRNPVLWSFPKHIRRLITRPLF